MPVKVLVVDDSLFFQNRLKEILNSHPNIEVVGLAGDGREAVNKARSLKPDVITMDYEMPEMDGIAAVREIMASKPVPIIMFSSLTYEGARVTLEALDAGAVDFMAKNFAQFSSNSTDLKKELQDRVVALAGGGGSAAESMGNRTTAPDGSSIKSPSFKQRPAAVVIGASTGGPVALTEVLTRLPANFSVPIVLVQHMPANFTLAFAERLNRECKITVKQAQNGDIIQPGVALLAPGGMQLSFSRSNSMRVDVFEGDPSLSYRPSVDLTFASAAEAFGSRSFGMVLTGMGSDGCEGARAIKARGGSIWSQDKETSVIYGMPMAVAKANLSDNVLPLDRISSELVGAL